MKKEGPKDEKPSARVVEDQTQARHQQRLVDCGARGRKGIGRRLAGKVFAGGCQNMWRSSTLERKSRCGRFTTNCLSCRKSTWRRCESVSWKDDRAVLTRPRFRADQANHEHACGSRPRAHALQGKISEATRRYRRACEKRPHHAPHRNYRRAADRSEVKKWLKIAYDLDKVVSNYDSPVAPFLNLNFRLFSLKLGNPTVSRLRR